MDINGGMVCPDETYFMEELKEFYFFVNLCAEVDNFCFSDLEESLDRISWKVLRTQWAMEH